MCRIHPMELEGSATRVGNTSLGDRPCRRPHIHARIKKERINEWIIARSKDVVKYR